MYAVFRNKSSLVFFYNCQSNVQIYTKTAVNVFECINEYHQCKHQIFTAADDVYDVIFVNVVNNGLQIERLYSSP